MCCSYQQQSAVQIKECRVGTDREKQHIEQDRRHGINERPRRRGKARRDGTKKKLQVQERGSDKATGLQLHDSVRALQRDSGKTREEQTVPGMERVAGHPRGDEEGDEGC